MSIFLSSCAEAVSAHARKADGPWPDNDARLVVKAAFQTGAARAGDPRAAAALA
jgi:hypothetical protein